MRARPLGWLSLARPPPASISVAEIAAAVEEGVRMTRCHGEDATPCVAGQRCLTRMVSGTRLANRSRTFLDSISFRPT